MDGPKPFRLRKCKEAKETPGIATQKYNERTGVPSQNTTNQHQMCGNDNQNMKEVPKRSLSSQERSEHFLLMDKQKEQMDDNQQSNISNSLCEEGRDCNRGMADVLVPPKEEVLVNSCKPGGFRSSQSSKSIQTEHPTSSGMSPEDGGDVQEGPSDLSGPRVTGNEANEWHQGEGEAPETAEGEDFYFFCPTCNERITPSSLPSTGSSDYQDVTLHDSQEEIFSQGNHHSISNDDYYEYIEEFLGEGTVVNIDCAQTCVDLGSGTIKTSVEISAEDDGVAVKHEVEWVTRFMQAQKKK